MEKTFMDSAIKEAKSGISKKHGGPFGAVIVKDGKVIAKAHNTVLKDDDPTCHAEMNAIRLASRKLKGFDLTGCEIYVTAEPCPMCLSAIYWARIGKVYYGATSLDTGKMGFIDKKLYDGFKIYIYARSIELRLIVYSGKPLKPSMEPHIHALFIYYD